MAIRRKRTSKVGVERELASTGGGRPKRAVEKEAAAAESEAKIQNAAARGRTAIRRAGDFRTRNTQRKAIRSEVKGQTGAAKKRAGERMYTTFKQNKKVSDVRDELGDLAWEQQKRKADQKKKKKSGTRTTQLQKAGKIGQGY